MTHRERIKKALSHQVTSKIPIDFGGTNVTGMAAVSYLKLLEGLGIKDRLPKIYDFGQQLSLPDREIIEMFGSDLIDPGQGFLKESSNWRKFTVPFNGMEYLIPVYIDDLVDLLTDEKSTIYIKDKDGTILGKMPRSAVHFNQEYWPYGESDMITDSFNLKQSSKHQWAIPNTPNNYNINTEDGFHIISSTLKRLHKDTDYAMIYPVGGSTILGGTILRGFDNFLCDIYQDRIGTRRLLDHLVEGHLELIEKVIQAAGEYVEAILFYDDFGHQEGTFIPVEVYRDMFKPFHKKMWDMIHEKSNCKVMLHCCGSIYELLPDFIEAGVDILNPVQTNAKDMEPVRLKKEFGKYLTFWGGGCDPKTLALGSEKEIAEEVKKRIDVFSIGGGFVFAPILNITAEVPANNIIAMYKTAMEY